MSESGIGQLLATMPFAERLGIELLAAGPEAVRASLAYSPDLCTAGTLMHGGVLMALADTCGGICAFLNLPADATGTATVESKTNFLRGVRDGVLTALATPLHVGRTLIVIESELRSADDVLVAKTTQTQAVIRSA